MTHNYWLFTYDSYWKPVQVLRKPGRDSRLRIDRIHKRVVIYVNCC